MRIKRNLSTLFLMLWVHSVLSEKEEKDLLAHHNGVRRDGLVYDTGYGKGPEIDPGRDGGYGHGGGHGHDNGHGGGYGHEVGHETGYGHDVGHGGGYGHEVHGGGGYGDNHQEYKPQKCYPQTITKYKTIYKERKAQVVNQVEVLNPRPHVKKVTETRYTTIRYPVFITQVIKPLLTQIETKVKPVFFTKTIDKYTTVLFTVTGIGQVTVTTVKYEKEYITRCMKKGYHHRSFSDDEGPEVKEGEILLPLEVTEVVDAKVTEVIPPSPHIPPIIPPSAPNVVYKSGPPPDGQVGGEIKRLPKFPGSKEGAEQKPPRRIRKRRPNRKSPYKGPIPPPGGPSSPLIRPLRRGINRSGKPAEIAVFSGEIGDVQDLYSGDIYYNLEDKKRRAKNLETSYILEISDMDSVSLEPHPPLSEMPLVILE